MTAPRFHPLALVESDAIGEGTRVLLYRRDRSR